MSFTTVLRQIISSWSASAKVGKKPTFGTITSERSIVHELNNKLFSSRKSDSWRPTIEINSPNQFNNKNNMKHTVSFLSWILFLMQKMM